MLPRLPRAIALVATTIVTLLAVAHAPGRAQDQTDQERFKDITDLDALTEKLNKEKKNRPPFEFFRSQVAPFDVLPFVKNNHWSTLTLELRSNAINYEGYLQTASETNGRPQVRLLDMPRGMVYRREALLPKEQTLRRSLQVLLPQTSKQLILELTRPGSIRPDAGFEAIVQRLEPHQMLLPVLSPDPSVYNAWSTLQATIPTSGDKDRAAIDRQRYYRLVLPQDPERPNLSPHPLTWTSTSHVVWDGFTPEDLSRGPLSQQQAMLDWLHWGGQLVIVAAGPNVAALQESFLGPYLPATTSGRGASLTSGDLAALSASYRPPDWLAGPDLLAEPTYVRRAVGPPVRYKKAVAIEPAPNRPLFVAGLEPRDEPGVVTYPVGDPGGHHLAVERRVGRGRIVMLAVNPNDPALVEWPGMDTLIRRLLLRRPEETWGGTERMGFQLLSGPELSWVRYAARDLDARAVDTDRDPNFSPLPGDPVPSLDPVAAWLDSASLFPSRSRETLETASGITIPGSEFVLRVILAYVAALVPLNWLVCRFVLRRRELAWAVVPFLALGFAYAVERAAAYDIGFDSACDEIDVLEVQGSYPRAHLSRFGSLYSTGRIRYEIAFPDDPTALALPMKSVEGLRGEEIEYSAFQSSPYPALADFQVQPRSLAMFRAEAMVDLGGGLQLVGGPGEETLVNGTDLDLHDAVLIDTATGRETWLGEVGHWPRTEPEQAAKAHEVALAGRAGDASPGGPAAARAIDWADASAYLAALREYRWNRPEDAGEVRLVAWADGPHPGERITPAVDRHRGFRLVVGHLRYGMPDPARPPYYDASQPPSEESAAAPATGADPASGRPSVASAP